MDELIRGVIGFAIFGGLIAVIGHVIGIVFKTNKPKSEDD